MRRNESVLKGNVSWADEQRSGQRWLRDQKFWSILAIAAAIGFYFAMTHIAEIANFLMRFFP